MWTRAKNPCWHTKSQLSRRLLPLRPKSRVSHVPRATDYSKALKELEFVMSELRSDPVLSKILDKPHVQRAIKDIQTDPSAIYRYQSDEEVMAVLMRLVNHGVSKPQMKPFDDLSTSPGEVAVSMFSNKELARLLADPRMRQALADIRSNPMEAMERYQHDVQVMRLLDLLQQSLGVVDADR